MDHCSHLLASPGGGGVPYGLTQILDVDSNYLRSIKAGRKIEESEDSPAGYQPSTAAPEAGMLGNGNG